MSDASCDVPCSSRPVCAHAICSSSVTTACISTQQPGTLYASLEPAHLACWQRQCIGLFSGDMAQLCSASLDAVLAAVMDDSDETGWKYIHGDVFRFPPHKNLFCAFVGSGAQVDHCCLPCVAVVVCLNCILPYAGAWSQYLSPPPALETLAGVLLAACMEPLKFLIGRCRCS